MELFDSLKFKVVRRNIKIVFPEATDPRILGVCCLKSDELVEPILIGDPTDIANRYGSWNQHIKLYYYQPK